MKSQNAQVKVARPQSSKWLPQFYSKVCNFCAKERNLWYSALVLRTELQQTYLQANSSGLQFCVREKCLQLYQLKFDN